jgi:biopolymer transport protein ExbB/TolQ
MKTINCALCGDLLSTDDGEGGHCRRCRREESRPLTLGANGMNPNMLMALLLAAICGVVFYVLGPFLLLRGTEGSHLFCGHGWVPYACVGLFFIALWALLLKLPLMRRQRDAFALQLLPEDNDARIEPGDTRRVLDRIHRLSREQRSLLLVSRVRQAMLRLNQLGTAEKLDDLLRYRAESDQNAMDSSYAAPKFIIWAIPVLGFVGTVVGISNGVQAFSTLIQNASDLDGLRESLKGVTYGLGQAFETTMIALCMSLILMFVMSWLQRREDSLLAAIDDYCMEHLLHKVSVSATSEVNHSMADLAVALREVAEQWKKMQVGSGPQYNGDGVLPIEQTATGVVTAVKTAR